MSDIGSSLGSESSAVARRARRELLANLVSRDLKSRYKGSTLGFLWTVLSPLFMAGIYIFFLRLLAGRAISMEGVLVGVFVWQFTAQAVQGGLVSITGNSNLVKKVFFSREILPASSLLANLASFGMSLLVLVPLLALLCWRTQGFPGWIVLGVLPVIALQALLNLSAGLLLGSAHVYFRDTQHLVGLGLSAWFFISPVMYDLGFVERFAGDRAWLLPLYELNPLAGLLSAYRSCLLGTPFPADHVALWAGLLWPVLLFPLARRVFGHAQKGFADLL